MDRIKPPVAKPAKMKLAREKDPKEEKGVAKRKLGKEKMAQGLRE